MFWTHADAKAEQTIAILDAVAQDKSSYKAVSTGHEVFADSSSELSDLHSMCIDATTGDGCDFGAPSPDIQVAVR